jgi:hypothetical protein
VSAAPPIDRKRFLTGLVGVPVWIAATGRSPAESMEHRVERILREYDAQGIHRTGTDGDARCARWLVEEARRVGAWSELEPMPFSRVDVASAFVELQGRRIEGVPLFDAASFTGRDGVRGRLGALDDTTASIGWAQATPDDNGGKELEAHRRGTAQKALVLATGGARWSYPPGLALINADSYRAPYGPPTVQVSSEESAALEAAAGRGVRVVVDAERTEVEVHNTLAKVAGRDAALAPLVVMTPRSGWWRCASERGGGIAVWLEMLAAIAAASPDRPVRFLASTGHELGHYGLEHHLESRQATIAGAHAWIHLGANFATSQRPRVLMQFSDPAMRALALERLAGHGLRPDVERPVGERPIGEVRNVADRARYVSILGQSGVFHHPDDRFPDAVDVPRTIAFAKAFAELGVALARA